MRTILVVPTGHGVGLTSVSLGLLRAFDRAGVRVAYCKPLAQPDENGEDISLALSRLVAPVNPPAPVSVAEAEKLLAAGDDQVLMERAVALCQQAAKGAAVLIVEGLVPGPRLTYSMKVDQALASALDAELLLVAAANRTAAEVATSAGIIARSYHGRADRFLGCIVNRVAPSADPRTGMASELCAAFSKENVRLLAAVPQVPVGAHPRVVDLARRIGAKTLNAGEWLTRRVERVSLCARTVPNALSAMQAGTLVMTPGDRTDLLLAAAMATTDGRRLAGVLLTGGYVPDPGVLALCRPALEAGLPLLSVDTDSWTTACAVNAVDPSIAGDDRDRAEAMATAVADAIDRSWLAQIAAASVESRLSPAAFRYKLIEDARVARKRIVLPEGDEPRTLAAAAICQKRGIARCVLLGAPATIREAARRAGVELPDDIEILDPAVEVPKYIEPMVKLREKKGLTRPMAEEQLQDTVVLGTMMLQMDDVDGLVSGAVHTTAHTIRPALQLVRTAPGHKLVSSVFFMCLPDQVLVYGDCAINPDPTAEELAEIAVQSADSAAAFGMVPRVAMISYSTGTSGSGGDVDKVREATRLAKERRPDLAIDGPLQYDAASVLDVARSKAPNSPVAGRATVFVFPDLNTGNTTYKAVQRSANVVSIGPMLQGLNKPVNDLSRGALVEDIVYTIALTAIQAQARPK